MLLPLIYTARFIVVRIESQVIKIHFTSTLSGGEGGRHEIWKQRVYRSTIYGQDCSVE